LFGRFGGLDSPPLGATPGFQGQATALFFVDDIPFRAMHSFIFWFGVVWQANMISVLC
jgi:hypothetical protein